MSLVFNFLKSKFKKIQYSLEQHKIKYEKFKSFIDPDYFFRSGELRILSTSLAYTTLISFIPFIAVVLASFQLIGGLEKFYPLVEASVLQYFKEATGTQVVNFLRKSFQKIHAGTLGWAGLIFLLATSYRLLSDADRAINRIWKIQVQRPFYKRMLLYWFLFLSAPVLLAMYAGFYSAGSMMQLPFKINQSVFYTLILFWGLSIFYIVIPDTKVSSNKALFSAFLTSLSITLFQQVLSLSVVKFFKQNKIYGSLATVPVVLLWILFSWYVILIGAYLCYRLQNSNSKAK